MARSVKVTVLSVEKYNGSKIKEFPNTVSGRLAARARVRRLASKGVVARIVLRNSRSLIGRPKKK